MLIIIPLWEFNGDHARNSRAEENNIGIQGGSAIVVAIHVCVIIRLPRSQRTMPWNVIVQ